LGGGHPSIVGENQEERERKIEAIQRDFSSALRASTPDELERAREAMHNWEAEKREREAQARLEREPKEHDDEKREQQARDYLKREAERVVKEREGDAMSESITMGEGVLIHIAHPVRERVESGDVVVVGLIIYDIKRDQLRCLPPDRGIAKDCWRDILLKFLVPRISALSE